MSRKGGCKVGKKSYEFLVGCYGSEQEETIHWLELDTADGKIRKLAAFSGVENPSYLTVDSKRNSLYVISEVDQGEVISFGMDHQSKTLQRWNSKPTKGGPCYVELGGDDDYIFTANYGGGSVIVHQLNEKGETVKETDFKTYDPEKSNVHTIRSIPGTSYFVATDLGCNALYFYRFEVETGTLNQIRAVTLPDHSGPRHIAFHPTLNMLYVVTEFNSTVVAYAYDDSLESIELEQVIQTLPSAYSGKNYGAEIHFSHGYLYVSNRGHHSLAVFQVLPDGRLDAMSHTSTTGEWPRHFTCIPDSDYVIVANEHTNNLVVMKKDKQGLLHVLEESYTVGKPVCVHVLT